MTQNPRSHYVRRFDSLGAADLGVAGGKGANLGVLVDAGVPVPSGFVVTTAAYRSIADDAEISAAIERLGSHDPRDSGALTTTAAEIRALIRERPIGDPIERAIAEALDVGADTTYAVRSSATAEDLPTASFAGQHDTHLGVTADAVTDGVRDCMASLFTDRAVAYRARNGIAHTDVEMAVVVQRMVDADAAGVLFTADPETGKRTVATVDATYGLGDAVVAGEVSADHARIARETGAVIEYDVGDKATERRLTRAGTTSVDTRTDRRETRVLTDAQLRTLVDIGERIEALFGEPQDIEWALVDGAFVILQSRPITSLVSLPVPRPDDDRLHVYLSLGHGQAMTDPMPPLALDLWEAVYGDVMNGFTGRDRAWITRTEGRAYMDITPFLGFRRTREGIVKTIAAVNRSAAEGTERLLAERREEFGIDVSLATLPALLRTVASVLPILARLFWQGIAPFVRGAAGIDEFVTELNEWASAQAADILATDDPAELVETVFAGFSTEFVSDLSPKSMRVVIGPLAGTVLERVVSGADAATVEAAARGNEAEVGTRMTLALGDIADVARETPAVERAILDGQPYEEVRAVDGSEAFVQAFDAFIDEFGHRAVGEFDPSRPRWRDDPSAPLGIVRGNLAGEDRGAHRSRLRERKREAQAAIDELQASADRGLLGPVRGPLVNHLLRTYRSHIHLRDEPKHAIAHLFAAWHEAIQRAGEHLVREDVLDDPDDVWFLRRSELRSLVDDPDGEVPDIAARKRDHERHGRIDIPPLITSEGEIPRVERVDVDEHTLVGTGVSAGVVEGVARIVDDPATTTLRSGEILVCPSSDPAWTPLFATAGGLVTEVGGSLTHGALVAREYGLPAVVSVAGATEAITDGQRIRVNGDTGTVELLTKLDKR
ncbi:pyruvate phosphate dikinase PEP/pyruvate-binding protein [Halorubrum aidingense JCM 13560]|uniref:Pyruvate phosphate dikinase PEP/pyruvate-binding protein n=1 Tax=Halorubrum aidingense JCM 13560 TaxID=1230454 RepID=M0PAQ2_9EURY|nr:PEP/pyruvate-binding domain-containing protein [Halorubrum aidingense]EMA66933.1 pyruvate phosphate dikinase PEP/pyruvate-binding protein [Halorubrum aidingense JCM 13560]